MGGGAWKVAYADFVTAMMAFFLLLWVLSMVPPETRAGLAAYFSGDRNFDSSSTSPVSNNPFIQNTDKIDARDIKISEVEKSHYAIAQKIKQMLQTQYDMSEGAQKLALIGALTLYLDFINLFLYLLRIFGGSNKE